MAKTFEFTREHAFALAVGAILTTAVSFGVKRFLRDDREHHSGGRGRYRHDQRVSLRGT